jgi:predicted HD superfamily hydrolase involved in NAD metabolism
MQDLIEQIKYDLKARLSNFRFGHTEAVVITALDIAKTYNVESSLLIKIEIAAWLHDSCKELRNEELAILASFYKIPIYDLDRKYPNLLHARVGAHWVENEYEILDPYILKAIEEHTLAGRDMLISSKILFLADMLEPGRDRENPNKDLERLREMIANKEELNKVLLDAINSKIIYMLKKNKAIHPLSIENRNSLLETKT